MKNLVYIGSMLLIIGTLSGCSSSSNTPPTIDNDLPIIDGGFGNNIPIDNDLPNVDPGFENTPPTDDSPEWGNPDFDWGNPTLPDIVTIEDNGDIRLNGNETNYYLDDSQQVINKETGTISADVTIDEQGRFVVSGEYMTLYIWENGVIGQVDRVPPSNDEPIDPGFGKSIGTEEARFSLKTNTPEEDGHTRVSVIVDGETKFLLMRNDDGTVFVEDRYGNSLTTLENINVKVSQGSVTGIDYKGVEIWTPSGGFKRPVEPVLRSNKTLKQRMNSIKQRLNIKRS